MAASVIGALQNACRADKDAFGLREAATAAGLRLTDTLRVLAEDGPVGLHRRPPEARVGKQPQGGGEVSYEEGIPGQNEAPADPGEGTEGPRWPDPADAFVAEFTERVAGDGTTVVDAALRRAVVASARRILEEPGVRETLHASVGAEAAASGGRGLAGDLLCLLYRWFFADLISEFLRAVIAEQIDLTVPGLSSIAPEGGIPDKVTDLILSLVPNPCEEATGAFEGEGAVVLEPSDELSSGGPGEAEAASDPPAVAPPLLEVARLLVPGTVGKVLGLASAASAAGEIAAIPVKEEPST
ncbi:hypothetical protein [Streptomyces sp. NPDC051561]|uniref:hypothetical protein n=1 Tax=Streptomyces sp. NPDC051561 TaxID=3365658 RepID=UPI0037A8971F